MIFNPTRRGGAAAQKAVTIRYRGNADGTCYYTREGEAISVELPKGEIASTVVSKTITADANTILVIVTTATIIAVREATEITSATGYTLGYRVDA